MRKIQIMLVDDHDFFRNGLKIGFERYEDIQVVGEAKNGREALEKVQFIVPDVIVMDVRMPEMNGIAASKEIQKLSHTIKILALTMHSEKEYCMQLINAGVKGILFKNTPIETIIEAIQKIYDDKYYFSEDIHKILF